MKFTRKILNTLLSSILIDKKQNYINEDILRLAVNTVSKFSRLDTSIFDKKWLMDGFYIIIDSIIKSKYNKELEFTCPLLLTISLTDTCNKGCTFCYSSTLKNNKGSSHIDMRIIERIAKTHTPHIILTGGEPVLHHKIVEILELLINHEKSVFLNFNDEINNLVPIVSKFRRRVTIILALYGTKEIHDKFRGRGNYDSTLNSMKEISKHGGRFFLNIVLHEKNDIINELLSEEWTIRPELIQFVPLKNVGRTAVNYQASELFNQDEYIIPLRQKFGKIVHDSTFQEIRHKLILNFFFGLKFPNKDCGAGRWTLHIDSKGNAYPCFAQEFLNSNINLINSSFDQVWKDTKIHMKNVRDSFNSKSCYAEQLNTQ